MNGPDRSRRVQVHHREGEKPSPDSGDREAICGELPRPDARRRWRDDRHAGHWLVPRQTRPCKADQPSRPGRNAIAWPGSGNDHLGPRRQREDVTAAPVARPARPGPPDRPHARTAGPARRAALLTRAAGRGPAATGGAESLPAAPEFNGQAMVDRMLSELAASAGPFVLIIGDLHELSSG